MRKHKMKDKKTTKIKLMDKLLSESELTERDVKRIGKKVKRGIAKYHRINICEKDSIPIEEAIKNSKKRWQK